MALTEAEINTAISNIHTQLQAMVTTPKPSYRVGEHSVSWNEYMKQLRELLKYYKEQLSELPAEEETIWRDW